jgi:hypothetical protein
MVKLNVLKSQYLENCHNHIFKIYWKFWELFQSQLFRGCF